MDATVLFADMIDSSTFSHVYDPHTYDKLVFTFQKTAADVVLKMVKDVQPPVPHVEAAVRGDELSLIMASVPDPHKGADSDPLNRGLAALALQIAVRLKRRWLLVPENVKRVEAGQPPLGIAIGIHAGPVVVGTHIRFPSGSLATQDSITAEGYAINLAKRVETSARGGRFSRVFLTRPIYNRTPSDFRQAYVRAEVPQLKGLPAAPTIYEAKGIGHFDDKAFTQDEEFNKKRSVDIYESIVRANPNEVWLLLDLAHKYFDVGEYEKAARKYESVIEVDEDFAPAHTYLGRAHFRDYRLPEAQACLERAVELNPGQARANNYLAVCLRRQAVLALFGDRNERARELLQRAVHYHDRACRISEGEGVLSFPWARNALYWTIAQCVGFESLMSLPYGIRDIFDGAENLHRQIANSDQWRAKRHLVLHTMGFIRLQQKKWDDALAYLKQAAAALENRTDSTDAADKKGYAERRSEILYHIGLCEIGNDATSKGLTKAISTWKRAKSVIDLAWGAEASRAFDGQYWINDRVETSDGASSPISALISGDGLVGRLTSRSTLRR